MNLFFQILIIAYLFFAVPVLLGLLEAAIFRKEEKSASEVVTNGYLIMLAMFMPIAVVFVKQEQALSALAKVWCIAVVLGSLAGLVFGFKILKKILKECKQFWQGKKVILLFVSVVSIVISLCFTKPATEDITALIVKTAVEYDSMYLVNPYSGYITGTMSKSQMSSPIEMFYAADIQLAGADSKSVLYYVIPIALLGIFFLTIWRVSGALFKQEEQRIWFEGIVTAFYWMTTYMEGHSLVTGIFLNAWNGLTILSCMILPLAFSLMLQWMQQAENGIKAIPLKMEKCIMMAVLILAAQLTNDKGGFYIVLMLFLAAAVITLKGGYTYVIKTGCFKKRI